MMLLRPYHPRPERWPQVSLKGFFVLVALLGMCLGWYQSQINWIHDRQAARQRTRTNCLNPVTYESYCYRCRDTFGLPYDDCEAPWPLHFFGERGEPLIVLWGNDPSLKSDKRRLEGLFPEAKIVHVEPTEYRATGMFL